MTGFDVGIDALRRHAGHIGLVGELVDEAVSAASIVAAKDAAFGTLIGPVIAPWLGQLEAAGIDAVRVSAATVQATAHEVHAMSEVYEHVDALVSAVVRAEGARD